MMKRLLLYIPILLLASAMSVFAQDSGKENEEDPFKNDPFFSKPIHEFFEKPDTGDTEEGDHHQNDEQMKRQLRRLTDSGVDYENFLEAGPYNSNMLYSRYPNLPMIHYNRVNGVFLGIKKERMQWYGDDWLLDIPSIQTHGLIGYSFGQDEWNYSIGVEKVFGRRNYMMAGIEYYNATATDDYWRVGATETTLTSLLAGYDYLDYYKQKGYGAYLILRSRRLFEGGFSYNDTRFNSLQQQTDWSVFGNNLDRSNPAVEYINGAAVDSVDIGSYSFAASFNPKRLFLSPHFTLTLSGLLEIADSGIGTSDYDYNKYVGELVTFINFEPGGVLKYRLKMGSISGEAPNIKEFQLGGPGSMRAMPYKSMAGGIGSPDHYANQMILSNAEIQFGSPSYSDNGWIDFDDFYLSLFLDSGWTNYHPGLTDSSAPFSDFSDFDFSELSHNGGVGLGSSLLRFELAWDLRNTDMAPVLWVRLNPTF